MVVSIYLCVCAACVLNCLSLLYVCDNHQQNFEILDNQGEANRWTCGEGKKEEGNTPGSLD